MVALLIDFWAEIGECRMTTTSVVEHFNVGEHTRPRFVAGAIGTQVNQLTFQCSEEAFHRSVVVPSAHAIHADLKAAVLEQGLIDVIGVLTALVGMVQPTWTRLALPESHLQGRAR